MADGEGECPDPNNVKELTSAPARAFSLALFVLTTLYFCGTILWWRLRGHEYLLRKRSLGLVSVTAFGAWLHICLVGLGNFVGRRNIPCDLYLWMAFLVIPLMAGPVVVRLVLFHNRAMLNALIVRETSVAMQTRRFGTFSTWRTLRLVIVLIFCRCCHRIRMLRGSSGVEGSLSAVAKSGSDEPGHQADRQDYLRALRANLMATKTYGYFALAGLLTMSVTWIISKYFIASDHYGAGCSGCALTFSDTLAFGVIVIVIASIGIYMVIKVRKASDPLGIVHELITVFSTGSVIFVGLVLNGVDPGGLGKAGSFDWLWISSFGVILVHTLQCPVQVMRTYSKHLALDESETDATLQQVLDSEAGRHALVSYLATEFSVENFYFYDAVNRFKARYDNMTMLEVKKEATKIAATFVEPGSMLEINVSHHARRTALDAVHSGKAIPALVFDEAQAQVRALMLNDSFSRFKKSTEFSDYLATSRHQTLVRPLSPLVLTGSSGAGSGTAAGPRKDLKGDSVISTTVSSTSSDFEFEVPVSPMARSPKPGQPTSPRVNPISKQDDGSGDDDDDDGDSSDDDHGDHDDGDDGDMAADRRSKTRDPLNQV